MTTQNQYITTAEAAQQRGVTPSRMRQYLLDRRIPGAIKVGRDWLIPRDFTVEERPWGAPGHKKSKTSQERSESGRS